MRVRSETTTVTHRSLVAGAITLIERDLDLDLGLEALADRAGVSPFHFHRLFRSVVGEPPASYVRRLRLERAAISLKYSRRPVTDIAFEAGYDTHEAFTRAFKTRFGAAPRRFRVESRHNVTLDAQPTIVRIPPRRIACVRHVGPYDETGPAFAKVLEWAGRRGLLPGATLLGVYWDDQTITPRDRTRCVVGLFVDDHAVGDGEVEVRQLDGGDHAVVRVHGPAEHRRRSYDLLYGQWLPERGRQPAKVPPFEQYGAHGGDWNRLDVVTDVHVPLQPTRAA
jgi:AraC family transcriptional regulator